MVFWLKMKLKLICIDPREISLSSKQEPRMDKNGLTNPVDHESRSTRLWKSEQSRESSFWLRYSVLLKVNNGPIHFHSALCSMHIGIRVPHWWHWIVLRRKISQRNKFDSSSHAIQVRVQFDTFVNTSKSISVYSNRTINGEVFRCQCWRRRAPTIQHFCASAGAYSPKSICFFENIWLNFSLIFLWTVRI